MPTGKLLAPSPWAGRTGAARILPHWPGGRRNERSFLGMLGGRGGRLENGWSRVGGGGGLGRVRVRLARNGPSTAWPHLPRTSGDVHGTVPAPRASPAIGPSRQRLVGLQK